MSRYTTIMVSTIRFLLIVAFVVSALAVLNSAFRIPLFTWSFAVIPAIISVMVVVFIAAAKILDPLFAPSGRWLRRFESWLDSCSAEIKEWLDSVLPKNLRISLVVAAGLTLFLELVLIRWEAGIFPVFALYKNFTLLACFCGLGLGYAMAGDKKLVLPACLPMVILLLLTFTLLRYGTGETGRALLRVVPVREEASVVFAFDKDTNFFTFLLLSLPVYLLLAVTFVLNTLVLLPAGQFCGHLMQRLQALEAYGCNLLGSIAGVALLFALSWVWAGPVIWFGIVAAVLAFFQLQSLSARRVASGAAIVGVLIAAWPFAPLIQTIYSPYQVIEKATQSNGLMSILASGTYYQKIYDLSLSNSNRETDPALRKIVGYYELPFKTAHSLDNVAIVGAGSGNDVAAALRNSAHRVDAVEIDPAIRDLGWNNHPEQPYQDARVHSIVNDARNFFRTTKAKYDAIIYGVLDSHVVVSQGSNMRVDSFVYTQEGLEDGFDHLKQGGLMSVSFALADNLMGEKVFHILKSFPNAGPPVAILTGYDSGNTTTFMVRKGGAVQVPAQFMADHQLTDLTAHFMATAARPLDLPTDDWPFFYLEKRMYPGTYLILLGLVLGMALMLVRQTLSIEIWQRSMMPFFFLGAGFMLVETKAITELGLLFGNTWQVVGITIVSVLVMAYLANLFAARLNRQIVIPAFLGLFVTLFVGYLIASHGRIAASSLSDKLVPVAIMASPLFFSGLVFSMMLKSTKNITSAMAYNIMGAMLGGVLEYNSMKFGFSFLYLIALGLYALAWLTISHRKVLVTPHQRDIAVLQLDDEFGSAGDVVNAGLR